MYFKIRILATVFLNFSSALHSTISKKLILLQRRNLIRLVNIFICMGGKFIEIVWDEIHFALIRMLRLERPIIYMSICTPRPVVVVLYSELKWKQRKCEIIIKSNWNETGYLDDHGKCIDRLFSLWSSPNAGDYRPPLCAQQAAPRAPRPAPGLGPSIFQCPARAHHQNIGLIPLFLWKLCIQLR